MLRPDSQSLLPQPLNQTGPPPPANGDPPKTVPERPVDGATVPK